MHPCPRWGKCHGGSGATCEKWPRAGRDCQAWKLQDWIHVLHLRAPRGQILPRCFLGIYCTVASANSKILMLLLWQNVPFFWKQKLTLPISVFKQKCLLSLSQPLVIARVFRLLDHPFHILQKKMHVQFVKVYRALKQFTLLPQNSKSAVVCAVLSVRDYSPLINCSKV